MAPRVLVISEDPLALKSLRRELALEPGLLIVEEEPDLAVVDAGLEGVLGLSRALAEIEVPCLILLPSPEHAQEALAAPEVRGVFLRDGDVGLLAAAIPAVQRGAVALDPQIAKELARRRPVPELPSKDVLTQREREVLELLAQGLSNKAIARALDVSDHTAKFHVTAIMNKLGAETRTEAVVLAARLGLVEL